MSEISEILISLRGATADQKAIIKEELINRLRPYTQAINFLPEDPTPEDVDNLFEALEGLKKEFHPDLNAFFLDFKKVPVPIAAYILDKIAKDETQLSLELTDFLQPDERVSHSLFQMLKTNNTLEGLMCFHNEKGIVPFPAEKALNEGLAQNKRLERIYLYGYSIDSNPVGKIVREISLVKNTIPAEPILDPIPSKPSQPVKIEEEPKPPILHPIPSTTNQPVKTEEEPKLSTQRAKITPIHCLAAIVLAALILYMAAAPLVLSAIVLGGLTLQSIIYFGLAESNKPTSTTNQSAHATQSQVPPQTVPTTENKPKLVPSITPTNELSHQKLVYSQLKK